MSPSWLGLDPGDGGADERHVEHVVLELVHALGLDADLVCTHTVAVDGVVRKVASVRLPGGAPALESHALLGDLQARWPGGAILEGSDDEAAVEVGPRPARAGARLGVAAARAGLEGRASRFPGQDALDGPMPVGDVHLISAIALVEPAVGNITADTVFDPAGYVRPTFRDGRLVLLVCPGPDGSVVPLDELENHACAGH